MMTLQSSWMTNVSSMSPLIGKLLAKMQQFAEVAHVEELNLWWNSNVDFLSLLSFILCHYFLSFLALASFHFLALFSFIFFHRFSHCFLSFFVIAFFHCFLSLFVFLLCYTSLHGSFWVPVWCGAASWRLGTVLSFRALHGTAPQTLKLKSQNSKRRVNVIQCPQMSLQMSTMCLVSELVRFGWCHKFV